jgi:hypothetical protein
MTMKTQAHTITAINWVWHNKASSLTNLTYYSQLRTQFRSNMMRTESNVYNFHLQESLDVLSSILRISVSHDYLLFNIFVSTFCDWFWQIRMRPSNWHVGFSLSSAIVQSTLSSVKLHVLLYEIKQVCALESLLITQYISSLQKPHAP